MKYVKLFEQFMNEMLGSHDIENKLKKQGFDIIGGDYSGSIYVYKLKDPAPLLDLIKKYGWFVSKWHYAEGERITKEGTKEADIPKADGHGIFAVTIEINKGEEMEKSHEYFHATPLENIARIFKKGLVPKSKNLEYGYPDRIYLEQTLNGLEQLIPQLRNISSKHYGIVKISDTNQRIKIRKDPATGGFQSYYTTDYIPASCLSFYDTASNMFVTYQEWSKVDLNVQEVVGDANDKDYGDDE